MSESVQVKVGQMWENRDPRMHGRTFIIVKVDAEFAYYWLDRGSKPQMKQIALKRMKPRSNGYRLVREA